MPTPDATTLGIWLVGAAAVVTAVVVLGKFTLGTWRFMRKVGHFLDDWFGEPARDGQEARPSMPVRVTAMEKQMGRMCDRVGAVEIRAEAIEHEMHPNSGASLRDAVDDIRAQTRRSPAPAVQQTFVTPPSDSSEE